MINCCGDTGSVADGHFIRSEPVVWSWL